jgi:hypothetical protein
MMWAKAPIYMRKGVSAPAPETNHKWLERTREGGPTCLRQIQFWSGVVIRYKMQEGFFYL